MRMSESKWRQVWTVFKLNPAGNGSGRDLHGPILLSLEVFTMKPCTKCGLKFPWSADTGSLCELCFWKKHKRYDYCRHLIRHGLAGYGWHGSKTIGNKYHILEDGIWYRDKIRIACMLTATMNCGTLNRVSKIPEALTHNGMRSVLLRHFPEFWVNKFY